MTGRKAAPGAYWVQVGGGDHAAGLTRVRVGPLADRARAVAVVRDLERQGFKPFIHAPGASARN